jgi:WhiB family transcriptional regulator, redox-sensing transcriptional regulator
MFDTTKAACKDTPTEVFFPEGYSPHQVKAAKDVCSPCEIKMQCLQWAIANNEVGVWGGTSYPERRAMSRRKKSIILNTKLK